MYKSNNKKDKWITLTSGEEDDDDDGKMMIKVENK